MIKAIIELEFDVVEYRDVIDGVYYLEELVNNRHYTSAGEVVKHFYPYIDEEIFKELKAIRLVKVILDRPIIPKDVSPESTGLFIEGIPCDVCGESTNVGKSRCVDLVECPYHQPD